MIVSTTEGDFIERKNGIVTIHIPLGNGKYEKVRATPVKVKKK